MKIGKIIGGLCLSALAASLIPYKIKSDPDAHTLELRSLLLGIKKYPGEDKDHYAIAIPASGLDADLSEKLKAEAEPKPEAEPEPAVEAVEAAE